MPDDIPDLVVIGGGPAGLSAAITARQKGMTVTVLEREAEAGGAPRHCGHPGFGMRDMQRLWTGPRYAAALRKQALGLDLRCGHAVTALHPGGEVAVSGPQGAYTLKARRVLLATGIRETHRAAQLTSGNRPFGIFTTGALQRFVYLHNRLPCRNPVVIGTEMVAYSTLLTLRHMQAKPLMLLEEAPHPQSPRLAVIAAKLVFGVPTHAGITLVGIEGLHKVEAVSYLQNGTLHRVACDGVIFSGGWVPEAHLARLHPMGVDPMTQGPAVDPTNRTSDPQIYAAGNVLGSIRTSGPCAVEGRRVAAAIARELGLGA